jgi:DNA polymerase III alpha subunit (gram-positive type)
MKIIIFDTEYLSLSKRLSNIENLKKFQKKLFPEIIQISFLKCLDISLENQQKKLNIFIKIKQKIPKRITKLTNITLNTLQKKGHSFKESMKLIDKFINEKILLIANGEDLKLLKMNIKYNNIKKRKKKTVNYINLNKILKGIDKKKNYNTENLDKIFNLKVDINPHNASNDCVIIHKSLRQLIKIYGKKDFENMILKNKKKIKF